LIDVVAGSLFLKIVTLNRHSRGSGNPGLVIKKIKYKKNGNEKIYYSTGFPPARE
jgi:hypothetical protein